MKRIVVKLSGMPFDPTYEIEDDTIAVGRGRALSPAADVKGPRCCYSGLGHA